VGNGVGVHDIDGAIGGDGPEEGSDDSVSLIRSPDVAVTDVKEDEGVYLSAQARRRWVELKHCLLLGRRHLSLSLSLSLSQVNETKNEDGARAHRRCGFQGLATRKRRSSVWAGF